MDLETISMDIKLNPSLLSTMRHDIFDNKPNNKPQKKPGLQKPANLLFAQGNNSLGNFQSPVHIVSKSSLDNEFEDDSSNVE